MSSKPDRCNCPLCSSSSQLSTLNASSNASQTQAEEEEPITPLPKLQLFIIIFIQVAEPVTSTVIYPFVNDLVRTIGITKGDEKKTGYFVGLIESIFYAAEAVTVLHWGRASDKVGRRPILLGGMLGLAAAMLCFGMSKRYWMLILSRCAQGAFNGNIGVTKSIMAEITDATNAAQAFSFLPVVFSIGSTFGPLIGGAFTAPAVRWPASFGDLQFFKDYPYFLPCFVATLVPLFAFFLAFIGLKETLPSIVEQQNQVKAIKALAEANESGSPQPTTCLLPSSLTTQPQSYGATATPGSSGSITPSSTNSIKRKYSASAPPPPFRSLFIPQVLIPITNFGFLAFLDQSLLALLPLIYSTPISLGGLGLPPSTIGNILGLWGVLNGALQVFGFAWVRKRLGHRMCYQSGLLGLGICFSLFPVLSLMAEWDGGKVGVWVWAGIMIQLSAYVFAYMSYACMFMYIAAAAPSRSSLGTTNGLAQLTASSVRTLAPSTVSSLFSFSLELGASSRVGGHLVYIVLCTICTISLWWSTRLPKSLDGDDRERRRRQQISDARMVD